MPKVEGLVSVRGPLARRATGARAPVRAERVPASPYTTVALRARPARQRYIFVRWPAIDAETPISRARRAAQPVTASHRRSSEAAPRTAFASRGHSYRQPLWQPK